MRLWSPSGPFFVGTFRILQSCLPDKPPPDPAPNPGIPGSRKLSVPGRVHSVHRVFGSRAGKPARCQPFCDSRHGRIVCKTLFLLPQNLTREPLPSNQPKEFFAQPLCWLGNGSQNSCAVHCFIKKWRTTASNQSFELLANPFAGWRWFSKCFCSPGNIRAGS